MFHIFIPRPGRRFSRFDLWVYRLFYRHWAPHLRAYPDVREAFLEHLQGYHNQQKTARGQLYLVPATKSSRELTEEASVAPPLD